MPSRDGSKNPNLVDFILPAWAGLRRSYGCLSYTELDWGKDAHKVELGAGSTLADTLSVGPTVSTRRATLLSLLARPPLTPPASIVLVGIGFKARLRSLVFRILTCAERNDFVEGVDYGVPKPSHPRWFRRS